MPLCSFVRNSWNSSYYAVARKSCRKGRSGTERRRRERRRSRWEGDAARQTSGWRAEEQTLKNGGGQMRVLFTRSCMRSSRCRYSRFPLFEDFYNWRETVSRINASTKGRSSELFNGIIITCSLDITFLSSFHRPRPFLHAPLFRLHFVTAHFYSWHFFPPFPFCFLFLPLPSPPSFLLIRSAIFNAGTNVETRSAHETRFPF